MSFEPIIIERDPNLEAFKKRICVLLKEKGLLDNPDPLTVAENRSLIALCNTLSNFESNYFAHLFEIQYERVLLTQEIMRKYSQILI